MENETPLLPLSVEFGYNVTEELAMLLLTGITNLFGIPVVILLRRTGRYFEAANACFLILTSFMYHTMQSVEIEKLFLTRSQWHRLDNIASILGMMSLFVILMDNRDAKTDLHLLITGFIIAIVAQEKDPWNVIYTVIPIVMYFVLYLGVLVFRKRNPFYNRNLVPGSVIFLFLAFFSFFRGLNEREDYLRINHALWHLCISGAYFHFAQISVPVGNEVGLFNFWKFKYTDQMHQLPITSSDSQPIEIKAPTPIEEPVKEAPVTTETPMFTEELPTEESRPVKPIKIEIAA